MREGLSFEDSITTVIKSKANTKTSRRATRDRALMSSLNGGDGMTGKPHLMISNTTNWIDRIPAIKCPIDRSCLQLYPGKFQFAQSILNFY